MDENQKTIPERLSALETHMKYTVLGIDELKSMLQNHTDHPCQACTLKDEVAVNSNDITWLKKIVYSASAITSAGILTLVIDRFTGVIDKILQAFST